jgi:20S proteasome subunit beta 7
MGRGKHLARIDLTDIFFFFDKKKRFLAYVDLLGVTYSASTLATGYGAYIAQPLLRKAVEGREDTLAEHEAREILEGALRVLFYRDARSINQVLSI